MSTTKFHLVTMKQNLTTRTKTILFHMGITTKRVGYPYLPITHIQELLYSLFGATFSFPINKSHSIKRNACAGVFTRTGSDFNSFGIIWQYRWAEGF
jgi:hypothetical protein